MLIPADSSMIMEPSGTLSTEVCALATLTPFLSPLFEGVGIIVGSVSAVV
jgi:hypothetical protein